MVSVEKNGFQVRFFKQTSGKEPVRDWLKNLDKDDRKVVGEDLMIVQYCWPVGPPTVKPLGGGLWEVRSDLKDRWARIIFCLTGNEVVLLHAFYKKTDAIPKTDMDIAKKRQKLIV